MSNGWLPEVFQGSNGIDIKARRMALEAGKVVNFGWARRIDKVSEGLTVLE